MAKVTGEQIVTKRFRVVVHETYVATVKPETEYVKTGEIEVEGNLSKDIRLSATHEYIQPPDREAVVTDTIFDQSVDDLCLPALVAVINSLPIP